MALKNPIEFCIPLEKVLFSSSGDFERYNDLAWIAFINFNEKDRYFIFCPDQYWRSAIKLDNYNSLKIDNPIIDNNEYLNFEADTFDGRRIKYKCKIPDGKKGNELRRYLALYWHYENN